MHAQAMGALGLETLRAVTNILYRVERAHWRYQDHLRVVDPSLPYLSFQVCVLL